MNYEQTNVQRIVSWLRRGEKTEENVQIGVETEHFVIDRSTGESIGYEGSPGVLDLLQKLSVYYDTQVFVDGFLMGVKRKDCYITLEPAAQLELSIGTRKSIAAVETCYDRFYAESMRELEKNNLTLATIGYQPRSKISELMMIPKRRYACMSEYLPTKGQHALNMMKGTASTQVSLDYVSEADFAEKFRIANCMLQHCFFDGQCTCL
jgi:glutamate--cysteine ligase